MAAFIGTCALLATIALPAAAEVGVGGDDSSDQYVVHGGVLLDSSFTGGIDVRRGAVWCAECVWTTTVPCVDEGPSGRAQPCGLHGVVCANGTTLVRVWRRENPAASWVPLGLVCGRDRRLTTVDAVSALVDVSRVSVPELRASTQPATTAIVGVPVWLRVSQPRTMTRFVRVLGWRVRIDAAATWTWSASDSFQLVTTNPGSTYPAGTLRHTFSHSGNVTLRVTTRWQAGWRVGDLPQVPVAGSINQSATIQLAVRPARTVLVPTVVGSGG